VKPAPWERVFRDGRDLYTVNRTPGTKVYGETLSTVDGVEYRVWDPFHSKLAAFLLKGAPADVLGRPRTVLYLGAAHGTTVSHLSDLWPEATIFAIEKSPTSFARLLALARQRPGLVPILADAQLPERYQADVGAVELLYQDIAQRNQAGIFAENARACLSPRGRGVLMLKVRSVTQQRPTATVVREARGALSAARLTVAYETPLTPFSREHVALALALS
jgi:fibrillarin-like pre-rRNA processing protein